MSKTKQKKIDFDGQREGEEVLMIFRRHFLAIKKGLIIFCIILIVTSMPILIWNYQENLLYLFLAGLLVGSFVLFYHVVLWYFSFYIVTNQRIRQVVHSNFFAREVVDLDLSKVQNISYSVPGFSAEAFHFGTIVIQTLVGDLVIRNVGHPNHIYNQLQDILNDLPTGN